MLEGFFFNILKKNFIHTRGFDTSYDGKDKRILKRYLNKNDIIDEKIIILRHILEHIPDPYSYLKFLKSISTQDPDIIIEVPDYDWIIKKQNFYDIVYEHVNYFSLNTFKNFFNGHFFSKKMFNGQYLFLIVKLSNLNLTILKKNVINLKK